MSKIYAANNTAAKASTKKVEDFTQTDEFKAAVAAAVAALLPQKAAAKTEHCSIDADGKISRPDGEFRLERLRQTKAAKWDFEKKAHFATDLAVATAWVKVENQMIDASVKLFADAEIKSTNTTKTAAGLEIKLGYITRIPSAGQKRDSVGKVQHALESLFDAKPQRDVLIISPQNFSDFVTFGGWAMSVR